MAHAINSKQDGRKNCPIVCQAIGERDIPAQLIKPSGFTVKLFYNQFDGVPFEAVAREKGLVSGGRASAANKADAPRLFAYKSGIGPDRA